MDLHELTEGWAEARRVAEAQARVLVVDDEPAVCMTLASLFGAEGLTADTAATLQDARSLLAAQSYDLLVIDKNLPDGSGIVLVEEVSHGATYIPSVVITGFPSATTLVDSLSAGAADYLAKPFGPLDQVRERLVAVLRRRLSRRLCDRMVRDLREALDGEVRRGHPIGAWIASQLATFRRDLARRLPALIVEDHPTLAVVLRRTLEEAGVRAEVVGSFDAVRTWLGRPDGPLLALVSVDRPAALDAIGALRALDPRLEILVTSERPQTDLALGAVEAGAGDYVVRAMESIDVLPARVHRALGRARRRHLHLHLFGTLYRAAQRVGVDPPEALLQAAGAISRAQRTEWIADDLFPIEVEAPPPPRPEEIDLEALFDETPTIEPRIERGARPTVTVRRTPAETGSERERRRSRRLEVRLEVRFQVGGGDDIAYGHLKNVSAGGLFLPMTRPLPVGTRLAIEVRPGWNTRPIQVAGEVVRQVHPGEAGSDPGVGVHLIAGQTELEEMIERLAQAGDGGATPP